MYEVALTRLHERLDKLLAELSGLSQRVARIEVQESRVLDNSKDIDKLEDRCEIITRRLSKLDVDIIVLKNSRGSETSAPMKSRAQDYAEKGGLVVSGGAVVELMRWIVELLKAPG